MKFGPSTTFHQSLFYPLSIPGGRGSYFLLPSQDLAPSSDLYVSDLEVARSVKTNFAIGIVGRGGYVSPQSEGIGYLFHSMLPVNNYHTSLLSFSKAWRRSKADKNLNLEGLVLVLKRDHFYLYHSPGIASFVTCPEMSDRVHAYLTMI